MSDLIIEKLSLPQLDELVKKQKFTTNHHSAQVEGYIFLNKDTFEERLKKAAPATLDYHKPFEEQNAWNIFNYDYDVNIVARQGDQIAGLAILEWKKSDFLNKNIWNYYSKFLEVHSEFTGNKLGSKILQYLEADESIQGKVLRFGNFSDCGGKQVMRKVLPKIFTNKNYYVLPKNSFELDSFPQEKGCYITENTK